MVHFVTLTLLLFQTVVHAVATPPVSLWPWSHRGDVRAVVNVPTQLVGRDVVVPIVWRRHDANPEHKAVFVTDNLDVVVASMVPVLDQHHGVVAFKPQSSSQNPNNTYYVYWLPYTQSGIGAGIQFAWVAPSTPTINYTIIGSFQLKIGQSQPQQFNLSKQHTGTRLRWQCNATGGHFQPFVREIRFRSASSGWLTNTATKTDHAPVTDSSGEQPSGTPPGTTGPTWMSMDGNDSTWWDATTTHAWVDIVFANNETITTIALTNYGDSVHDCSAFTLFAVTTPPNGGNTSWKTLPVVPSSSITIEARNDFESFAPMELAANSTEVAALLAQRTNNSNTTNNKNDNPNTNNSGGVPYLLFTEPREFPVRMQDRIPIHWTTTPAVPNVTESVVRGEFHTWQLAVYVPAGEARLENISVKFEGFTSLLSPTCFNLGGVNAQGENFTTPITIEANRVYSFWIGVQIPATLSNGTVITGSMVFEGTGAVDAPTTTPTTPTTTPTTPTTTPIIARTRTQTKPKTTTPTPMTTTTTPTPTTATTTKTTTTTTTTVVAVTLTVDDTPAPMSEPVPTKMTRLRWLNSDLYTQDYGLVPPYTAVTINDDNTLQILNRVIVVGDVNGNTNTNNNNKYNNINNNMNSYTATNNTNTIINGNTINTISRTNTKGNTNTNTYTNNNNNTNNTNTNNNNNTNTNTNTIPGLPTQINVTRAASIYGTLPAKTIALLASPIQLTLFDVEGVPLQATSVIGCMQQGSPNFTTHGEGLVSWYASIGVAPTTTTRQARSGAATQGVCVTVEMSLAMEGFLTATVSLQSTNTNYNYNNNNNNNANNNNNNANNTHNNKNNHNNNNTNNNNHNNSNPKNSHENENQMHLSDIRIHISLAKQHGLSWMGLDKRGQHGDEDGGLSLSKGNFSWRWTENTKSNEIFVGSANAGMKVRLRGNTTEWLSPIERFYDSSEILPDEWGANNGLGGINASVTESGGVDLVLFTGPQTVGATSSGSSAGMFQLNFDLTITPFKTPDEQQHWSLRHFQVGYPGSQFTSVADVAKTGANVINIHQGVATDINPYINYPFIPESVELLTNYTREANELGIRVKFYYTVRELTNHAAEIFALRMLGDEVYATEPICGYDSDIECSSSTAWQRLHLSGNFSSAWTCPLSNGEYDAAIRQNKLAGRWLNYYIEGLRQSVVAPPYIQGVYYDGILFGRDTMLRARKVLERDTLPGHPRPLMDFHAGNDDALAGRSVIDAVAYANNWAFVDSLWIGEGFSYDSNPVFWLFEISGAPFGLFSDMLGTPNNYRGMLFGSTGRPGTAFPKPMWNFWDEVKINQSDMVGFWQEDTPVTIAGQQDIFTNDAGAVIATCYVNKAAKRIIIAVASWATTVQNTTLQVDWEAIGMDTAASKTVKAPAIEGFQVAQDFGNITTTMAPLQIEPAKGTLLVVQGV